MVNARNNALKATSFENVLDDEAKLVDDFKDNHSHPNSKKVSTRCYTPSSALT
jgi:hypothetical protein